ncbi:hypothetical protein [Thauera humireducens]
MKRLAHPSLHSPIFELMAEYILGLKVLQAGCSRPRAHRQGR